MVRISIPEKWDYEADVVIVGAGTAGFPAAIEAHDAGAKTVILEILPIIAPSLPLINVGPAFAGTDIQEKQGIKDSPEEYYKDGIELAKGDPELWQVFSVAQLETYHWCKKIGMTFEPRLFSPPGHRITRGIWKKGGEMLRSLEKAARDRGIEVKIQHRATRLITDPMTGRVVGLKVREKDKEERNFKARRAVILATGGFGRNRELIAEYGPYFLNWLPTMGHGHLGDGLKMAMDLGAATKEINHAVCGSFGVDIETKSAITDFVGYAGGIFVNVNGERFADESMRQYFYGIVNERGMKQPGHVWFAIYDEKMKNTKLETHMMHKAKPVVGNTIEELAQKMGIEPAGLKKTVDRYNKNIETLGRDPDFDRTTLCGCEGVPLKLETPPFYGLKCTGSISSFKGGLKINTKSQVINQYGEVIPSLYAAGEVTGGLWGYDGTYLPCTMVTASMAFGRIAGKNAANEPAW
jgi:fumarate reductase flavoprotein subunit